MNALTTMDHPDYPLKHEQRAAIVMLAPSSSNAAEVLRIQREFAKRRDAEFPGWREKYEAEVQAWIAWHAHPRRRS